MKLRQFVFGITIMGCLLYGCADKKEKALSEPITTTRPNIILFVADDHGMDALGSYGNKVIKTPHLDQLATEGVRFNNAYCTSASCSASRSVILTGLYGHATGSYGHVHDYHHFSTYDKVKSLPLLLEKEGYATARIGKYHVAPESVYHFQEALKADPRNTVEMAEQCKDILASEKPFFLYFCTDDPHRAASTDPGRWDAPNSFGNKVEGFAGVTTITYDPEEVIVPDFLPDTKESREEIAQYYQSVSRIDQGFGRLMQMLKESGKADNTIVIYISDNGMAFPGAKTTLYEPGMKLPCIIKDPFSKLKNTTSNAMISWVDLAPTILDMAMVETKENSFHGRSFKEVLNVREAEGWDEVYASHTFHEITMYYPMRVVREKNYKLIRNIAWRMEYPFASDLWAASTWQEVHRNYREFYGKRKVQDYLFRPEFELFDLEKDPDEMFNLANDPDYKEVMDELIKKMKDFQLRTKDPWLITWDHDDSLQGRGVHL
jgi:N-sulfoglucosamine sulfohydrolase